MAKSMIRLVLPAVLLAFTAASGAAETMAVEQAWARATPPGATNGAAFMTLVNAGAKENALVGAESDAAGTVELHTHIVEEGVARMRQVPEITVPAGGRTELRPGGLHIMLIGLKAPLIEGGVLSLKLKFRDGATRQLSLPVRRGSH